jgi:hypothetical protein
LPAGPEQTKTCKSVAVVDSDITPSQDILKDTNTYSKLSHFREKKACEPQFTILNG